jgi:hypothetical protein
VIASTCKKQPLPQLNPYGLAYKRATAGAFHRVRPIKQTNRNIKSCFNNFSLLWWRITVQASNDLGHAKCEP